MRRNLLAAGAVALAVLGSNASASFVYELELTGTSPTPWDRAADPSVTIHDDPVVITIDYTGCFQITRPADIDGGYYAAGIPLALYLGTPFAFGDDAAASTWDHEIELARAQIDSYMPSEEAFEE